MVSSDGTSIVRSWPQCVDVLEAMRTYRRSNMLLTKLEAMRERMKEDGFMAYSQKYGGAHTFRDSGDGGLNMQNLPRAELLGINMRGYIEAPPGKKFISSDLSQIEPRILRWLIKDQVMLGYMRQGYDPYEAFARATLGYTDPRPLKEVDPKLRALCKIMDLALGYGVGPDQFRVQANREGVDMSDTQARFEVNRYRATNVGVMRLWNKLETEMKASHNSFYEVRLPSGRSIHYWRVQHINGDLKAQVTKYDNLQETGFYKGKLTENLVQAVARDAFMYCVYLIEGVNGLPVLMRVHDEVLVLTDEENAERDRQIVERCMSTPPPWAPDLPIQAEARIVDHYTK